MIVNYRDMNSTAQHCTDVIIHKNFITITTDVKCSKSKKFARWQDGFFNSIGWSWNKLGAATMIEWLKLSILKCK